MSLAEKDCVPCQGGIAPMLQAEAEKKLDELSEGWSLEQGAKRLEKTFDLPNMTQGGRFVNAIVAIAESQGHHPDVHLAIRSVKVEIWTHKINGLHESDFILGAKIDRAFVQEWGKR